MEKYLGIDIGGTFIKYGIITQDGEVLSRDKVPTMREQPVMVLEKLVEIIEEQKEKYNIEKVGISIPGVINSENRLITSGAIEKMYEYDISEIISKETGLDIKLTNDANAIAYAEKWVGAGKGCKNFVCLPLGTGVGGAIVIDGKIVKGRVGAAGEFGMSLMGLGKREPIRYDSTSFYCGAVAGLCRMYNFKLGIRDFSKWERNIETIMERAFQGQKEAIESLEEFYNNVAILLLNVSVSLDPEMILIGGGVSENEIIMRNIETEFRNLTIRYSDVTSLGIPKIRCCKLGNAAGMIGAVVPFVS